MIKHNDNLENKEKVKYDLYKILRMSILLSQNEVDELTLTKFKEASLNIDKMLGEEYDKKLDTMFYDTTTLEEEEQRLKELVALVSDRIEKRKELLEDYRTITTKELTELDYIEKSSDLDLYEQRLDTIKEYLDSSKLIEVNEDELEKLKEKLVEEYDLKSENEIKNTKIEEELYNTFVNCLYEMDLFNEINVENIDKELENLQKELVETKEQKDTFINAFENLKLSGITGELEIEYASYVENSKKNYYYVKEKEILLNLYKLIEEKEQEYHNLYNKREEVKRLLQERTFLRSELNIKEKDYLLKLSNLIYEQKQEIENEKENVDNINVLTERIKLKENRLEELNKKIKKPEILSILKEYSLIDTYDQEELLDDTDLEEQQEEKEEVFNLLNELLEEDEESSEGEEKVYQPNEIKESNHVPSMNFGLSRLKSISVMKRVGDMLGLNAKKEEIKKEQEEKLPVVEELEVKEKQQETIPQEDLFWTPVEFEEMKTETEEKTTEENIFVEQPVVEEVKPLENELFEPFKEQPLIESKEADLFVNETPSVLFKETQQEVKTQDLFFEQQKENKDIFASSNNEIIFPEPIMPTIEHNPLPKENKQEDKFMWPENMETFDLNGIFPN